MLLYIVAGAILQILLQTSVTSAVSWEEWWTYDGISGPAFWGLINPEWSLCNKGRRQSPVNLEPNKLLFDPNLRPLHIDKHRIQIFGFNSQLYTNFSEALHKAQGIVVISLLLQMGDLSNPELRILTDQLEKIRYGGDEVEVKRLSVRGLLPETDYYMTYDGSTTMPACHETVTWLILNKPIYITKQQMHALRRLMQGDAKHPKAPLGNNFRPPQPLHHRPVRTNIDFSVKHRTDAGKQCPSMYKDVYYKANSWKQH
ncbi:carbonic anhydrase-related protein 10 isoform X2 [Tenebrio molitor]|uniref:carbonic anhydrase-related protein 10 isoform X2 n=1 Tax=Tenebrio molitor TaxID=7067 RepID=UPI0036246CA4